MYNHPKSARYFSMATAILLISVVPVSVSAQKINQNSAFLDIGLKPLDNNQLSHIRGGFDMPGVTINFAFSQTEYLGQSIVQSILVPVTTLTSGLIKPVPISIVTDAAANIPTPGAAAPTVTQQSATPTLQMIPSTTQNISQPVISEKNTPTVIVQTVANQGNTDFLTQLGSGGLTNIITNQANGQLIQEVSTVDIGITGLSMAILQGQSTAFVQNSLTDPR